MADQSTIVEFLSRPETHGIAGPVERIDTHISSVFLAGDRAVTLKRAGKLPYVDFHTLEQRRAACDEEVRVNRRTAPSLYLGVEPIVRTGGTLRIGGAGKPVEFVVLMRRFDQDMLFDRMAARGVLSLSNVRSAASRIAQFHDSAERCQGGAAAVARVIEGNRRSVRRAAVPRPLARLRAAALVEACRTRHAANAALLDQRAAQGFVRDGHGDLHLRNICVVDGEPTPFDAIEFDPVLRRIDVFYDFAFLLMDLLHRKLDAHANLALNIYTEATGDRGGLACLPMFLALRAIIRGHVTASLVKDDDYSEPESYFALAERALEPRPPRCIALGGLSGTGKSTLARVVAPLLGAMPGAIILRSDKIRKRLAGVAPEQRLAQSFYTAEWTGKVYAELLRQAEQVLGAGHSAVLDAVAGAPDQRAAMEKIAAGAGAAFHGIWLEAPLAVREARIGRRTDDASDADVRVVRQQREPSSSSLVWPRLDASGEAAAASQRLREALGLAP